MYPVDLHMHTVASTTRIATSMIISRKRNARALRFLRLPITARTWQMRRITGIL